jgi:hypothetical protein
MNGFAGHLMTALVLVAATLSQSPPSQADLMAFYTFEGNANDVSGHDNHGTVQGATLAAGYEGQAYDFDGNSDYIGIPMDIDPTAMPYLTMGAWANTDAVNAIRAVISNDDGGYDRNLNIDNRGEGSGYRYSAFTGGGVVSAGSDPAPVGTWVFVAARYSQSDNKLTLDVGTDRITVTTNLDMVSYNPARIGSNPGFGEYFDGRIDNVFIYDEILSDERIDQIRQGGAGSIVPESATFVLFGVGLAALAVWWRTRRA